MNEDQNPPVPSALRIRRGAVIGAAGISGLLVLLSMVVDPVPSADGPDLIRGYSEDLTRSGWHTNLIHYGFALFAPVVYAMVGLVRARGAWLANVAGVFAILGLSTLPGLVLLDFTSVAAALATDVDTAWTIEEELGSLPAFILIVVPAFVASMLALPLAIIALWRAGLFPGIMAALALPAAAAPQFAPTWWLGFGVMAAWMLAVAWFLARIPREHWYGSSVRGEPRPVAASGSEHLEQV